MVNIDELNRDIELFGKAIESLTKMGAATDELRVLNDESKKTNVALKEVCSSVERIAGEINQKAEQQAKLLKKQFDDIDLQIRTGEADRQKGQKAFFLQVCKTLQENTESQNLQIERQFKEIEEENRKYLYEQITSLIHAFDGVKASQQVLIKQFDTLKLQNDQLVKLSQNNRWMTVIAASAGSLAALVSIEAFFIG